LWSAFLFRQLLWVYDERDKAGMLGPPERDLRWVPRGWKPRFPSWSWISVDYPVCTMAADELPSMFKVVSIERAHSTTFTNNPNGPALVLRLWGQLQWFDWPAQQLDRQKSAGNNIPNETWPTLDQAQRESRPGLLYSRKRCRPHSV
jgi:hypothetical protein